MKEDSRAFMQRLRALPGVVNASNATGNVTTHWGTTTGVEWPGKDKDANIEFGCQSIDVGFIETMGLQMVQGRSYSADFPSDSSGLIINEAAAALIGFSDPVGKEVNFWGEKCKIVGVVKNFHFKSVHKAMSPWLYYFRPDQASAVVARLQPENMKETVARIESLIREMNPGSVPELRFMDEDFQAVYQTEQRVGILSRYFAGIAILISCLGLLGLAAFSGRAADEGDQYPEGVGRKRDTYYLPAVGRFHETGAGSHCCSVACWFLGRADWLNTFAYRIELQWWYFVLAGVLALVTAWLTVGSQAVKAARVNPVRHLKD